MPASSRAPLSILALMLVLAGSRGAASADSLEATYQSGSLHERAHRVTVELDSNDLLMRVRRDIRNTGKRVEEASLRLTLPPSAVVSGLRTKQGEAWIPGVLLDSKEAASIYDHYTSRGGVGSSGPALLSWEQEGEQSLRIFPISPRSTASVELELKVPTCYRAGKRIAFYPKTDPESGLRPVRLHLDRGIQGRVVDDVAALDSRSRDAVDECIQSGELHRLDYAEDHFIIVVNREPAESVSVRFGGHALGAQRNIGEFFVELGSQLEEAPREAALVFVLDASLSQTPRDLENQITLVEGYLAHLPDARFQIVLARRFAQPLFASFQPSTRAPKLLRSLRQHLPERGNGSNLDVATRLALSLLAPFRGSPQRLIAFTDSRLRQTLDGPRMAAAVREAPSVLMHLIDTSSGSSEFEFERDDGHALASAVMATGGMMVSLHGDGDLATARAAMLGLVRPTQIDSVTVEHGTEWQDLAALPDVLPEGFGYRAMGVLEGALGPVSVRGKLWGRDLVLVASHDSDASLRIPAMAFGRDIVPELTANQMRALANVGHVVSPATSFLSRNPTSAPTSYDYEDVGGISGMSMSGISSSTSCIGIGHLSGNGTMGTRTEEAIDYGAALAGLLKGRAASCATMHQPRDRQLSLQVETTGPEIVDVLPATDSPYARCVEEATWDLRLGAFFAHHEGRVTVGL